MLYTRRYRPVLYCTLQYHRRRRTANADLQVEQGWPIDDDDHNPLSEITIPLPAPNWPPSGCFVRDFLLLNPAFPPLSPIMSDLGPIQRLTLCNVPVTSAEVTESTTSTDTWLSPVSSSLRHISSSLRHISPPSPGAHQTRRPPPVVGNHHPLPDPPFPCIPICSNYCTAVIIRTYRNQHSPALHPHPPLPTFEYSGSPLSHNP